MTDNMTGKLIVIDGTDGAGKRTQSMLLISHLEKIGRHAKYVDFPRHKNPSAALVDDYLNGKFGSASDVSPYAASIFYAVDRFAASFEMRQLLADGYDIVCDRYVSANMGHQSGKIHDLKEKDAFLDWVYDLEFNIFNLPKPDVVIILHVSPEISQQLVDQKDLRLYLGEKKRDIHENDVKHLYDAEQSYIYIAKKFSWPMIDCAPNGKILSREEIHELLWNALKPRLIE